MDTAQSALIGNRAWYPAIDRGSDAVIIGAVLTAFALDLVLSKEAAAKKGIIASSTPEQRLAALRGLRIGVSGPEAARIRSYITC